MRSEHLGRIWEFNTKNLRVTVDTYRDDDVDLSFDETGEISEQIDSGEMVAFWTEVKVTDRDGNVLGRDTLSGSIYKDPQDFRDHVGIAEKSRKDGRNYGSYFSDMVREACGEARKKLLEMSRVRVRDPEAEAAPAPGM